MQSVNCSYIVVTDLITAGVILVAADSSGVAVPLDGDGVDKVMQESAWDQCLRTLHRMVDVHPSARDYALALGGLKQRHRSKSYPACLGVLRLVLCPCVYVCYVCLYILILDDRHSIQHGQSSP